MRYSVGPEVKDSSLGPKPRENTRTPIPKKRATRKCPSSWMKMSTPMTTTKERALPRKSIMWFL